MSLEEHEEGIKSMESKIYFPGKGLDLSAFDKSPSPGTIELGLLKNTTASTKAMGVGVRMSKEAVSPKEECYSKEKVNIWEYKTVSVPYTH